MNRTAVSDRKFKILLVDDHPLVRQGLRVLFQEQPDFLICGEAASVDEALEQIPATKPDLAVVDISLKDSSGIDLIKMMRASYPDIHVVVLSMHEEKLYAERAIRAGARGYVTKRETTKRIVAAIRQVLEGKFGISEDVAALFEAKFANGRVPTEELPVENLSDREIEIFRLLGQGFDTRRISNMLHISLKTVQTYCRRIKDKLELGNATELLREAIRWSESHP